MSLIDSIVIIGLFLAGIYVIAFGARVSYLSGFKFYLVAGLLQSASAWLMLTTFRPWAITMLPLLMGAYLRAVMKERHRTIQSPKWQKWEQLDEQYSPLDRLLLYRGSTRMNQAQDH
jgi:hypothetical protein